MKTLQLCKWTALETPQVLELLPSSLLLLDCVNLVSFVVALFIASIKLRQALWCHAKDFAVSR